MDQNITPSREIIIKLIKEKEDDLVNIFQVDMLEFIEELNKRLKEIEDLKKLLEN